VYGGGGDGDDDDADGVCSKRTDPVLDSVSDPYSELVVFPQ